MLDEIEKLKELNQELINENKDLKFNIELLVESPILGRFIYDKNINENQYNKIQDVLDVYMNKGISSKEECNNLKSEINKIISEDDETLDFCKELLKCLADEGRYEILYKKYSLFICE